MPESVEIPRYKKDELDPVEILSAETPVIVEGEASTWPAVQRWTWSFFREHCGETWVPARHGSDPDLYKRRMRALIDELVAGDPVYAVDWDFSKDHPELANDVGRSVLGAGDVLASIPEPDRPRFFWLYLGAPGTGSALHQDVLRTHAWLALLSGTKRWVQYAPDTFTKEEARMHDAFSLLGRTYDRRFERTRWEAEVSAGDVMFVPSLWWHQVENMTPTVSLTANFANRDLIDRVRAEAAIGQYKFLVPHLDAIASREKPQLVSQTLG